MLDSGTELEILKWVRGSFYRRRRDAVLADVKDMAAVVEQSRRQPDRRIEIVATILLGWKERGPQFEEFWGRIVKVDVKKESSKITGLGGAIAVVAEEAARDFGEDILPYCWEQILKFSEDLTPWQVETMLLTIGCVGAESSVEPLLWFIEQTTDPGQIDSAHQALLKLPYEGQKQRLLEMKKALALHAFVVDDLLARIKAAKKKP